MLQKIFITIAALGIVLSPAFVQAEKKGPGELESERHADAKIKKAEAAEENAAVKEAEADDAAADADAAAADADKKDKEADKAAERVTH